MKYKVGQLVMNRKLGLGKVLGISGDDVITYFKNEQVNPRTINVVVVPMEIPSNQSDEFFDGPDGSNIDRLSKPTKVGRKPKRVKKEKVEKTPAATA